MTSHKFGSILWYTISESAHDIFVKHHKGDAMKSLKIIGIVLASLLVIVGLSIGGYEVMKQVEHNEMVGIVESEEAKEIFKLRLKQIDPNALTEKGIIKSYKVDSFEHNLMGGIIVYLYINDSSSYNVSVFLHKDSDGKLRNGGGSNPPLEKLKGDSN